MSVYRMTSNPEYRKLSQALTEAAEQFGMLLGGRA